MASVLPTKSFARIPVIFNMPDLIEVQLDSFKRLKTESLADLFHEISPIESYNKGMKLYFPGHSPEAKQWDGLMNPNTALKNALSVISPIPARYMYLFYWLDRISRSR